MITLSNSIFGNFEQKFFKHKDEEGVVVRSINHFGIQSEKKALEGLVS